MDADALFADVVDKYSKHVNPYLAKLLQFAGFGVEMRGEAAISTTKMKQYLDCLGGYGTVSLGHRREGRRGGQEPARQPRPER